MLILKIS